MIVSFRSCSPTAKTTRLHRVDRGSIPRRTIYLLGILHVRNSEPYKRKALKHVLSYIFMEQEISAVEDNNGGVESRKGYTLQDSTLISDLIFGITNPKFCFAYTEHHQDYIKILENYGLITKIKEGKNVRISSKVKRSKNGIDFRF